MIPCNVPKEAVRSFLILKNSFKRRNWDPQNMKIRMLLENISFCCTMIPTLEVLLHDGAASGFGVGTAPKLKITSSSLQLCTASHPDAGIRIGEAGSTLSSGSLRKYCRGALAGCLSLLQFVFLAWQRQGSRAVQGVIRFCRPGEWLVPACHWDLPNAAQNATVTGLGQEMLGACGLEMAGFNRIFGVFSPLPSQQIVPAMVFLHVFLPVVPAMAGRLPLDSQPSEEAEQDSKALRLHRGREGDYCSPLPPAAGSSGD